MPDNIEQPQAQAHEEAHECNVLREAAVAALLGGAAAGAAIGTELAKHKNEIADVGKAVLEGGIAGGVGAAVGRAVAGHEKEIKVGVDTVKNEIVSTPNDVIEHVKSKPLTAACEFLLCPPLVIVGAKIDKYLRK